MAGITVSCIKEVCWPSPPTMDEFAHALATRYKTPLYALRIDLAFDIMFYCSLERKIFVVLRDRVKGQTVYHLGFFHSSTHSKNLIPLLAEVADVLHDRGR